MLRDSLRAKVLLPVVVSMGLALVLTVWTVNHRLTQEFKADAARTLAMAEDVFRNSQKIRTRSLLERYRNLPNEPRYKAVFQAADPPTIRHLFAELLGEQGADVIGFTSDKLELVAGARRDPAISMSLLETASAVPVNKALGGEESVATVRVGDRLFDVIVIPVTGVGESLIGALTIGVELGGAAAREFNRLPRSQIVLLADGRVVASTLPHPESNQSIVALLREAPGPAGPLDAPGTVRQLLLEGEHYFCSAGRFDSGNGDKDPGYLLLWSYEQPLRALQATRQELMGVSLLGILLATGIIWLFVRRATRPLLELRALADAVGHGDFSRRAAVATRDECGQLAAGFNRMTENLRSSRDRLEETVARLKTTQAQLVQSEKLSGIGQFVAGVAHELNNPLTIVLGFSELVQGRSQDPEQRAELAMIYNNAQRCHRIVQSLLSFARRHAPERKLVCLNQLLQSVLEFLAYELRTSNIAVVTRFDPHLPLASVDPHQLQQVFLNLINNARQAIEAHQPKGCVTIITESSAPTIRVTIQDDGPGIAPENLSKIFDPFFTTKEVGKGTGLGLSLCYGILQEHGGTIFPRSRPGEGAAFIIELPVSRTAIDAAMPPTARDQEAISREGSGKRVLAIDDEPAILQLVRRLLECGGFEVDVAADGETGLRRLSERPYDVILCDWKMPGLTGQDVYERLQLSQPHHCRRMIFMTGDVVSERTRAFLESPKKVYLPKPFTVEEFRAALSQILAGG